MNRADRIVESDPRTGFGGDAEENAKRQETKDQPGPAQTKVVVGPAERKAGKPK